MKPFLILFIFLIAFVFLRKLPTKIESPQSMRFQKASYYQVVALNYDTFVSSLLWVRSMIAYGEGIRSKHASNAIIDNGLVVGAIDPRFKKIYEWYPAIPLGSERGVSNEEFEKIDTLMRLGIKTLKDPQLNYSAAMNHIGYNRNLTDPQKRHFYEVAADILQPVLTHPQAPDKVAMVYSYFKKGGHFQEELSPEEEVSFITNLLLSSNEMNREPLLLRLEQLGYSDATVERKFAYDKAFEEKKKACCAYFPEDLLLAYGFND